MKNVELLQLPMQKFCLTQSLKQSIQILQMSQIELSDFIEAEVDLNPCLVKKMRPKSPIDFNIAKQKSIFEDLTDQAAHILNRSEKEIAKNIFGNLSEEGFLLDIKITDKILPVLKKVQTLEPAGICALNLKDSLLIQLKRQKKEKTLAYKIIEQFFDDYIHKRWQKIAAHFNISVSKISDLTTKDLSQLCLRPAEKYLTERPFYSFPDIYIHNYGKDLHVSLNNSLLPVISLKKDNDTKANQLPKIYKKRAIKFIENLCKRDTLLLNIGKYLIKEQKQFFLDHSNMKLLSISKLAKLCNVHESSVHRCIRNKYLLSANNIIPLKVFFKGQVFPEASILDNIKKVIEIENKNKPLSDLKIMQKLEKLGINISRRTVTKYRKKLKLPATTFRKTF